MPKTIAIIGPPGTGKTSAAMHVTKDCLRKGTAPNEIAYLTFTKAAAEEGKSRVLTDEVGFGLAEEDLPFFRTIHSLAYRGLAQARKEKIKLISQAHMRKFSQATGFDGTFVVKGWEDLADAYQRLDSGGRTEWDQCLDAYSYSRISAHTPEDFLAASHTIARGVFRNGNYLEEDVYRAFVSKYEEFKRKEGVIDYTDMLAFAYLEMKPLDGVKHVIVDEVQDCAPILYGIVYRLFESAETIWLVGDANQCQPAGTLVHLGSGNTVPIEELKVGQKVRSYDRRSSVMIGRPGRLGREDTGASVLKVASRKYAGPMYTLEAGGRKTRMTPEHRFLIRWNSEARRSKVCVTYLMQRGARFRVGWCQLFNATGTLHLNIRAHIEKADRAWVLAVHVNRTDASIHESYISCEYGIPTITFEPVNGATHLTREAIDKLFEKIGDRSRRAEQCLMDHGRYVKSPFYDASEHLHKKRTTLMEIEASNLLAGLMLVPVDRGDASPSWEPFSLEVKNVEDVDVYSLDVERQHTYVADGIVTHNCIYSFAGADPRLFLDRMNSSFAKVILRKTHRFGQEIVDFSTKIIERAQDKFVVDLIGVPNKEHEIRLTGSFEPSVEPMFILHRHVMGCKAIGDLYMSQGLPFRNERGRNPLGYGNRIRAFKTIGELADGKTVPLGAVSRLLELMPMTMKPELGEKGLRLVVHGAKRKAEEGVFQEELSIQTLVSSKILTEAGADVIRGRQFSVFEHAEDLEYYQRVIDGGHSLEGDRIPVITTIHGSKGRQAPRVVVFSEMGRKCWVDPDTEHRLAYVASTRTQGGFEICGERTLDWAEAPYNYPMEDVRGSEG